MKARIPVVLVVAGLMTAGLMALAIAGPTRSIFELGTSQEKFAPGGFKPAPGTIETRFGTLQFPGGYPTEETAQKVYDELDLQRATQLFLDMYPALSMRGMMLGTVRDYGSKDCSHVAVTADRLDSQALFLTGNTESIYAMVVFDLKADGPTVFQAPAGLMGPVDDANFLFAFDIGPTGQDKGKGGKYLILPPGYEGDVPDGYFVFKSPTYRLYSFVRANAAVVGTGEKAMEFFRKNCRVYPLKDAERESTFTNVSGVPIDTLVPESATAFEWMHELINYEPAEAFGKEKLGRLASIGIVKGKPFAPDARMKRILDQAAKEGVAMSRVIAFDSRQPAAKVYPNRRWESPYIGDSSSFDPEGYFNLEARTTFHFTADGITPAMAAQMPDGLGSRYQTTYKDQDGKYFDGNKTYKLHMPPNVPVKLFWAVTVYDPWTRCEIQSQRYPSISSQQKPAPSTNADGSIDIYFSVEKPADVSAANWVKTLPNQGFFVYMRYYGPLKAFNEKTWIPNDVELVPASAQAQGTMPSEPLGGKPPAGSKPSVPDLMEQVKYQRAFEVVIWSMPAVAKYGLHRATFDMGAGNNEVLAWSAGAKPLFEALTPNNTTPYVNGTTDLRKGPVVLDVPPANAKASLFGQVADNWYITIADIGPIGVDQGKGGKILLTPPGYKGEVPAGMIEVKSPCYILDFAFRSIPSPDGTPKDAYDLGQQLQVYYLSELPNPKPTRFVDPLNMRWPTLCRYDERWFQDLHTIIDVEPVRERDKAMMGMLKAIGIEKGKPFAPDEKTKAIFRRAVADAYFYMQQRYLTPEPAEMYWPDRRWRDVFFCDANMGFAWDLPGILDYDNRSIHPWFTAIYFPAKVTKRPPTMYLATARDRDGNLFQAGKTYKLTVPKDVPINKFWSLTVYDMETWAFIYTKEERPGLSSREIGKMKQNADGSVTLYVGPKAPAGYENNWIPTAGKTPYLMFRFYGPEEPFYNKTFKLEDVELAD